MWALGAGLVVAAAGNDPATQRTLERAAQYVVGYEGDFRNVLVEEVYRQQYGYSGRGCPRVSRAKGRTARPAT